MNVPHAGPLSLDEFRRELRWSLAQVACLLDPAELSDERLQKVRVRVRNLGDKAQYVLLTDRAARTELVGELGRAAEALRDVRNLQENNARHQIKEAEDWLNSALGAFGRAAAGLYTEEARGDSRPPVTRLN